MDYGEVVAAEHFNIDGVVDARGMRGTRMSDIKITVVLNGANSVFPLISLQRCHVHAGTRNWPF